MNKILPEVKRTFIINKKMKYQRRTWYEKKLHCEEMHLLKLYITIDNKAYVEMALVKWGNINHHEPYLPQIPEIRIRSLGYLQQRADTRDYYKVLLKFVNKLQPEVNTII